MDDDVGESSPDAEPGPFHKELSRLLARGVPDDFLEEWKLSESQRPTALPPGENPLVSIIMLTDDRPTLREAIESAVEQTYGHWELLVCDEGSEGDTESIVKSFSDSRIRYTGLSRVGAARARNVGLSQAGGHLIAYLDSGTVWHPEFLEHTVVVLTANPGRYAAYARSVDDPMSGRRMSMGGYKPTPFDFDRLSQEKFFALNAFMHRRSVYEELGGFDERLRGREDWDLMLRYSFLRNPIYVDRLLVLCRKTRKRGLTLFRRDSDGTSAIEAVLDGYYHRGLPTGDQILPSVSVLIGDISSDQWARTREIAETLREITSVQLVGFRFESEEQAPEGATAGFRTSYFDGGRFPQWNKELSRAIASLTGDVVYAMEAGLPSLGLALLANSHFGKPVVLGSGDFEFLAEDRREHPAEPAELNDVDPSDPELLDPYGKAWTQIMEGLVPEIPLRVAPSEVVDDHLGGGGFLIRSPGYESRLDRHAARKRLGVSDDQRVTLLVGVTQPDDRALLELREVVSPADQILDVSSIPSPADTRTADGANDRATITKPERTEVSSLVAAADAVIIWLDPAAGSGRFHMPDELADTFAMRVPVLANDIGDLGDLGRSGYLRLVPYGDAGRMAAALESTFANVDLTQTMVDAAYRLYLRQFSCSAVKANMRMTLRQVGERGGTMPAAEGFAHFFAEFYSNQGAL